MNWKKFFIAFVVIYVAAGVVSFVIHGLILVSSYEALSDVWRPDMDRLMWIQLVTGLFLTFFFIYVYAKGYEGGGIGEGIRYGLVIWAFFSIPSVFNQYMVYPIPYGLVWQWLAADLVTFLIIGIIVSAIYKPQEAAAK